MLIVKIQMVNGIYTMMILLEKFKNLVLLRLMRIVYFIERNNQLNKKKILIFNIEWLNQVMLIDLE